MKAAFRNEKDSKVARPSSMRWGKFAANRLAPTATSIWTAIFIGAANNQDTYVRRSGVFALGCLGNKSRETLQALEAALDDAEPVVRQSSAWAVGQFGVAAVPLLKKALHDKDALVKRDAAGALEIRCRAPIKSTRCSPICCPSAATPIPRPGEPPSTCWCGSSSRRTATRLPLARSLERSRSGEQAATPPLL